MPAKSPGFAVGRLCALLLALVTMAVDPAVGQSVVRAEANAKAFVGRDAKSEGSVAPRAAIPSGVADYGPFRVFDEARAALIGPTDERSPRAFAAMLRAHPHTALLEMIACPGTRDDVANLRIGRMIRAHGIATHVPQGGFVVSGAVELFVAGARRWAEPSAIFGVHAWEDYSGRQPRDYPASIRKNRDYIAYYMAMGMNREKAVAFYAMTNSAPSSSVRWLTAAEMGTWVRFD